MNAIADQRFHVLGAECTRSVLEELGPGLIDTVEQIYRAHSRGRTVNPDSYFLRFPSSASNRIIALPAALTSTEAPVSGIKWISSFPANHERGLPRASAVLVLNDAATGFPFALLESAHISAYRTAASAVLGARALRGGKRRAGVIAVIGAGVIARSVMAMFAADDWKFDAVHVHDLHETAASGFSAELRELFGTPANSVSLATALEADIVLFATTAGTPYVPADFVFRADQTLLNISLRDLPPETILPANNVFDDVDHCLKAQTSPHLAEQRVGDRSFVTGTVVQLLDGECALDPSKASVYSPFGMGILDVCIGREIFYKALAEGRAIEIPSFFAAEPRR
ncbi:2,3-diaminopropionate biosynthesis protein SbnB [Xanthomonas oryzae pv. oryzicola]|uniref:2,3-diaminopropionate biosynthesis protein SbnB n=1 Tax=Xanthomonas oryzae TaxID=347 RepID=UPI00069D45C6|nr:2,3-diaminopropionate biosynthesis protein SbnB [Xanthomonas oryzae]WVN05154.1 2,3-diaminopropionate biosynthesis protein SbnB [Xanthomonas oryzae pv. oryzicola]